MTAAKSVSIRLGVDGKADVQRDFADTKSAGVQAFDAIADAADKASARAQAATDRQLDSYRRTAAQMAELGRQNAAQQTFNDALGVNYNASFGASTGPSKSAKDSAALFEAQAVAADQLAARVAALKAQIDPAWAAQQRYNGALEEAKGLLEAGAITEVEHAAAVGLASRALNDAEKAAKAMAGGYALSTMQMQELGAVAHRSFDAIAAGMSPVRVATMEGARLGGALGSGPGGIGQSLATVGSLFLRFLPVIAGVAAAVGGAALVYELLKKDQDDAAAAAKRFSDASVSVSNALQSTEKWAGNTTDAVRLLGDEFQQAAAKAKELAVNTLLASTNGLDVDILERQRKLAQQRQEMLATSSLARGDAGAGRALPNPADIDFARSFAAPTDPNLTAELAERKELTDRLTTLMSKPTVAFTDFKALGDSLDPTGTKIKDLTEKIAALHTAMDDPATLKQWGVTRDVLAQQAAAGEKEIVQLKKRGEAHNAHAQTLAREAASMVADAGASIILAQAYLQSDAAALTAEARRKAVTAATKKGIDVDAQAARQLALNIAEQTVAGAKMVRNLADETDARRRVNDLVAAGVLPADDANRQMQMENDLRPILVAQSKAEGEAKRVLTESLKAYAAARADANAEDARTAALQAEAGSNDNHRLALLRQQYAGDRTGAGAIALAKAQGGLDADKAGASIGDILGAYFSGHSDTAAKLFDARTRDQAAAVKVETDKQVTDRTDYLASGAQSYADQLQTAQKELDLVTASNETRAVELAKLKEIQDLQAHGVDLSTREAQNLIAQAGALEQQKAKLELLQQSWQELQQFGSQLTGDLLYALSPDHWMAWGDEGKAVLKDIAAELEKLLIVNPILNALFGGGLPTAGSVGGLLGSLFHSGASAAIGVGSSSIFSQTVMSDGGGIFGNLPAFANGTDSAPGGPSFIADGGPEAVWLPQGAKVSNAAQTRKMLSGGSGTTVHATFAPQVDARGADPAAVQALSAKLDELYAQFPSMVVNVVHNATQRGVLRAA